MIPRRIKVPFLKTGELELLANGAEFSVYALGEDTVVKVSRNLYMKNDDPFEEMKRYMTVSGLFPGRVPVMHLVTRALGPDRCPHIYKVQERIRGRTLGKDEYFDLMKVANGLIPPKPGDYLSGQLKEFLQHDGTIDTGQAANFMVCTEGPIKGTLFYVDV